MNNPANAMLPFHLTRRGVFPTSWVWFVGDPFCARLLIFKSVLRKAVSVADMLLCCCCWIFCQGMYQRCVHLPSKHNKYLRFVRSRLPRVECMSILGVGSECAKWSATSLPHWGCTPPSSLTRLIRSGLCPPLGFSQTFPSIFKVCISSVLLSLPFSVRLPRLNWAVVRCFDPVAVFHHGVDLTDKCPDFVLLDHFSQL